MKVSATIQARVGSTRLPNKVMELIMGKPMLELQIERIKRCALIDEIIIVTTVEPEDDDLEVLAGRLGILCYRNWRGSENDVLGLIVEALKKHKVELHVELFGDSPLPDPSIIDSFITYYGQVMDKCDYLTSRLKTTYPPGLEVSVYPAWVLIDAEKRTIDNDLRQHVGLHIYRHPDRYRIINIEAPPEYYMPELSLEVDEQKDFELITNIYEALYPSNHAFTLLDVIEYIKKYPELANINKDVFRRWKALQT